MERALSLTNKGPVLLLTGYQTPAAIRRSGFRRVETWLKNRKVKGAATLAQAAVEAAQAQHTSLPGETLAASMVARLAKGVMALEEEIAELDALIEARFQEHPHAEVIRSLPGRAPCSGPPSSRQPAAIWKPSAPPTGWLRSPAWHRFHATPVASAETCAAPAATIAAS